MLFGPKFVTFVFSDKYLKLAVAKPAGSGLKIYSLLKKELPAGVVFDGRITNETFFREALKSFFLENYERLKTRDLVLSLNEQEVFLYAATFEEKPRNVREAIIEKISPKLPYELEKAVIIHKEVSRGNYQVAATNLKDLQLLTNIFTEVGFSFKATLPFPLIFTKLAGLTKTSYLFISSEDDSLIYALVSNSVVAFSSTIKLKKKLTEVEKEVTKIAKEIIDEEYPKKDQEPLKDVFVTGDGATYLKNYFNAQNFNTQIVSLPVASSKQPGGEPAEFSRCLSLYFYDDSLLAFSKPGDSKATAVAMPPLRKGVSFAKVLIFLLVAAAILVALFFYWPYFKELPLLKKQSPSTGSAKVATLTTKPKEATGSADKKEATPSARIKEEINKADFKIQILNGTGKTGSANQARDLLVAKGYHVVSTGNAANFNYQTSLLQAKEGDQEIVDLLTNDLKERYTVTVGLPLPEGSPFDIIIIIGGK